MEASSEWKTVFPIGSVYSAALLSTPNLGPLSFKALPSSLLTVAFTPPTLSPPPTHTHTLPRFLTTSAAVLPSTASSLPPAAHPIPPALSRNRIRLLPFLNSALLFLPTGPNLSLLSYLLLHPHPATSPPPILHSFPLRDHSRIINIAVSPFSGHLLTHSLYTVHWLRVNIVSRNPIVEIVGFKLFKKSPIVDACWSPHIPEESAVLLEDGSLFLFDTNDAFALHIKGRRRIFPVAKGKWIGCHYTWHPRVFLLVSSLACYLADVRTDQSKLTLLFPASGGDAFVTSCISPVDHFHFVLVSSKTLILGDVRKPFVPLVKWTHHVGDPQYVDVLRLSDLRSNPKVKDYEEAVSLGCGIVLGSFWNCEFNLFCYGPSLGSRASSTVSAWEIPSEIMISGRGCCCGKCVFREDLWKEMHGEWIPWQTKREIVVGFGILSKYLDMGLPVSEEDEFGGFTVVRLTSSGKIEAQRFVASWRIDCSHEDTSPSGGEDLLYEIVDEKYKFPRRFTYLKLDYLRAYLKESLSINVERGIPGVSFDDSLFTLEAHKTICQTANACGFGGSQSPPPMSVVFNEITVPTSIHEIATVKLWSSLPVEILQLAFTRYNDVSNEATDEIQPLEFSSLPSAPQLPPFWLKPTSNRANKWSKSRRQYNSLVGPVLPLPILLALQEVQSGNSLKEFSVENEIGMACEKAMEVSDEKGDGGRDEGKRNLLVEARSKEVKNKYDAVLVAKVRRGKGLNSGEEMLDSVCPIELDFETAEKRFSGTQRKVYRMLKRHFVTWQMNFKPYKEYLSHHKL